MEKRILRRRSIQAVSFISLGTVILDTVNQILDIVPIDPNTRSEVLVGTLLVAVSALALGLLPIEQDTAFLRREVPRKVRVINKRRSEGPAEKEEQLTNYAEFIDPAKDKIVAIGVDLNTTVTDLLTPLIKKANQGVDIHFAVTNPEADDILSAAATTMYPQGVEKLRQRIRDNLETLCRQLDPTYRENVKGVAREAVLDLEGCKHWHIHVYNSVATFTYLGVDGDNEYYGRVLIGIMPHLGDNRNLWPLIELYRGKQYPPDKEVDQLIETTFKNYFGMITQEDWQDWQC